MKNKIDQGVLDLMRKDPKNWKWLFYVNRKDNRLIVPKMNSSMGWTLNFASPYSYIFLVLLILIIIVFSRL